MGKWKLWFYAVAAGLLLMLAAPTRAWFVLPPLVFDASRFAQQVQAVRHQVQWIESVARHLENDARMLRRIDYSNVDEWTTAMQRAESIVARVDTLSHASGRIKQQIEKNWPIEISRPGDSEQAQSLREAWVTRERETLAECRAIQNVIVSQMPSAQRRVEELVAASSLAGGLTAALQARTQLGGELSGELSKLGALRVSRALLRSEQKAREQAEAARAAAVRSWLMRSGGTAHPDKNVKGYVVEPVPEQPLLTIGASR